MKQYGLCKPRAQLPKRTSTRKNQEAELLAYFHRHVDNVLSAPPTKSDAAGVSRKVKLFYSQFARARMERLLVEAAKRKPDNFEKFVNESADKFLPPVLKPSVPSSSGASKMKSKTPTERAMQHTTSVETVSEVMKIAIPSVTSRLGPPKNRGNVENEKGPQARPITLAMVGLKSAGKTSLLNALEGKAGAKVRPTIGFRSVLSSAEEFGNIRLFDLGGSRGTRNNWENYYHDIHGAVFVVDASESLQLESAGLVFKAMSAHPSFSGKPVLLVVNKLDVEGSVDLARIQEALEPSSVDGTVMPIEMGASKDMATFKGGLKWISDEIKGRYAELEQRIILDTEKKAETEIEAKMKKERKVLKNKIRSAFAHELLPRGHDSEDPPIPEEVLSANDGINFIADEIGIDPFMLDKYAKAAAALVGYQRLALQILGALFKPISKNRKAMTWRDILRLVKEIRAEIGLIA